jgi:hypothetical protein
VERNKSAEIAGKTFLTVGAGEKRGEKKREEARRSGPEYFLAYSFIAGKGIAPLALFAAILLSML